MKILDSHVHCGLTLPLREVQSLWEEAGIEGGVLFAPVEEIYDRYDPSFEDSEYYCRSREKVHEYLESLLAEKIFIYWFVWNDFKLPRDSFQGIKWHRHADEPQYCYNAKECEEFIQYVCRRGLPVIIEEEFHYTLELVERFGGRAPVIIPHCGLLNGGYHRLKEAGLFENKEVYVDTALAGVHEMADFASEYGVDRIMFGSDFPFGNPARELYKVERVFSGRDREKVLGRNLLSLLGKG